VRIATLYAIALEIHDYTPERRGTERTLEAAANLACSGSIQ
jgi:hypothetical protein